MSRIDDSPLSDLQALVDSLAATIGLPVKLHDSQFRLLSYSSHAIGLDPIQEASILGRETPGEVIRWITSLGVQQAAKPMRIAANETLAMRPRLCVPIRFGGTLLGHIWLVDQGQGFSNVQEQASVGAAAEAATILFRERFVAGAARARERELVSHLVAASSQSRFAAIETILSQRLLASSTTLSVIVAELRAALRGHDDLSALTALERVRRTMAPRTCLMSIVRTRPVIIITTDGSSTAGASIAKRLGEELRRRTEPDRAWSVACGVSVTSLDELAFSYSLALDALRVANAASVQSTDGVVQWDDLGPWKLLSRLLVDANLLAAVHPGLASLAHARDAETLLMTLTIYLDAGGDAQRTSSALCIHRTSLYPRLKRIEQLAGVDLQRGDDRLALHMSLRILELPDARPAGPGADPR